MAKMTPEEMARKLGMTPGPSKTETKPEPKPESKPKKQETQKPAVKKPRKTASQPKQEEAKRRGPYFKSTPKKDAMLTISTTTEIKEFIDKLCIEEQKNRSQLVTEILDAYRKSVEN